MCVCVIFSTRTFTGLEILLIVIFKTKYHFKGLEINGTMNKKIMG